MGRGRQKAKQTKVARELKYHSSPLDSLALERELSSNGVVLQPPPVKDDDDDEYGAYARYAIDDGDDEPEPGRASRSPRR